MSGDILFGAGSRQVYAEFPAELASAARHFGQLCPAGRTAIIDGGDVLPPAIAGFSTPDGPPRHAGLVGDFPLGHLASIDQVQQGLLFKFRNHVFYSVYTSSGKGIGCRRYRLAIQSTQGKWAVIRARLADSSPAFHWSWSRHSSAKEMASIRWMSARRSESIYATEPWGGGTLLLNGIVYKKYSIAATAGSGSALAEIVNIARALPPKLLVPAAAAVLDRVPPDLAMVPAYSPNHAMWTLPTETAMLATIDVYNGEGLHRRIRRRPRLPPFSSCSADLDACGGGPWSIDLLKRGQ